MLQRSGTTRVLNDDIAKDEHAIVCVRVEARINATH
jgi:hypothetical protein